MRDRQLQVEVGARVRGLGSYRDGLLILLSAIYALGYFQWSVQAELQGWGVLPALEAQYFAAGIVPAVVCCVVYFALRRVKLAVERFRHRVSSRSSTYVRLLRTVLLSIPLVSIVLLCLGTEIDYLATWKVHLLATLGLSLYIMPPVRKNALRDGSGTELLESTITERFWGQPAFLRAYRVVSAVVVFIAVAAISALIMSIAIHSHLPASLGGLESREAALDLNTAQVSEPTRLALCGNDATHHSDTILRSRRVHVRFQSDDFLLIEPSVPRATLGDRTTGVPVVVYELSRSSVQAIVWLDPIGEDQ
jgi:hypothetical protein